MSDQLKLNKFIKDEMKKHGYSLRVLSKRSGIDHATLSKIMNGKRKVNLNHLQKLSNTFEVELSSLLEMAGYSKRGDDDLKKAWKAIQTVVHTTSPTDKEITFEHVNQEILKFENLSQTISGKKMIHDEFNEKFAAASGTGKYAGWLQTLYSQFVKNNASRKDQLLIGAALLYFIVTTDLVPDYLLLVGLLDDAFIVQVISQRLENKNLLL